MLLAVENLHVHYGRLPAVRGVSLYVDQGEFVCIVGPNGAGKSTTTLAIAGALSPTRGEISLAQQPITRETPESIVRRGISLVPEGRRIFASLTVEENLRLGATARSNRGAVAQDLDWVLGHFRILRERLRGPAGRLSGGEQQMLAIGRALMSRPRLLILDEPSLGLAPRLVDQVYAILDTLRREGTTLLVIEQSTTRAIKHADRLYVLRTGRIELSGSSEDLHRSALLEEAYFGFAKSRERALR
jgi:branched-chain amino acid transport system ATP-binding protein